MKKPKNHLAAAALALGMSFAMTAWAESQVSEPGALGIAIDPNASGTKIAGNVSFVWDFRSALPADGCEGPLFVRNLYAVATMIKGNQIVPSNAVRTGFCFDDQAGQVQFLNDFIRTVIIPGFYSNCVPGGCPGYAIKSIKNFMTTGRGAGSMEMELAVK